MAALSPATCIQGAELGPQPSPRYHPLLSLGTNFVRTEQNAVSGQESAEPSLGAHLQVQGRGFSEGGASCGCGLTRAGLPIGLGLGGELVVGVALWEELSEGGALRVSGWAWLHVCTSL